MLFFKLGTQNEICTCTGPECQTACGLQYVEFYDLDSTIAIASDPVTIKIHSTAQNQKLPIKLSSFQQVVQTIQFQSATESKQYIELSIEGLPTDATGTTKGKLSFENVDAVFVNLASPIQPPVTPIPETPAPETTNPETYEPETMLTEISELETLLVSSEDISELESESAVFEPSSEETEPAAQLLSNDVLYNLNEVVLTNSILTKEIACEIELNANVLTVDNEHDFTSSNDVFDKYQQLEILSITSNIIYFSDDSISFDKVEYCDLGLVSTKITTSATAITISQLENKQLLKPVTLCMNAASTITIDQSVTDLSNLAINHDYPITIQSYNQIAALPALGTITPATDVTKIPEGTPEPSPGPEPTYSTDICIKSNSAQTCIGATSSTADVMYTSGDLSQHIVDNGIIRIATGCSPAPTFNLNSCTGKTVKFIGEKTQQVDFIFPTTPVSSGRLFIEGLKPTKRYIDDAKVLDDDDQVIYFNEVSFKNFDAWIENIVCNTFTSDFRSDLHLDEIRVSGTATINDETGAIRWIKFDDDGVEIEASGKNTAEIVLKCSQIYITSASNNQITLEVDDDIRSITENVQITLTGTSPNLYIDRSFSRLSGDYTKQITINYGESSNLYIETPLATLPQFNIPSQESNPYKLKTNVSPSKSNTLTIVLSVLCALVAVAAIIIGVILYRKKRSNRYDRGSYDTSLVDNI